MIKSAIEKILELGEVESLVFDDREYTSKVIYPVKEPKPETVKVNTLTAVSKYLEMDFDGVIGSSENQNAVMVHVIDHSTVAVRSSLIKPFSQRFDYITAELHSAGAFHFGHWYDVENFVIQAQACFIQDDTRDAVLKIVGNIQESAIRTVVDDGIGQTVKTKSGITRVEEVVTPNPVILRPFRTFREIEQPASKFIFRWRAGKDGALPSVALFEADGGVWQIEAMHGIANWMKEHTDPKIPVIF